MLGNRDRGGMAAPSLHSTSGATTRRGLLGAAAVAPLAALPAVAAVPLAGDQVLASVARLQALRAAQDAVFAREVAARAALVARWGEIPSGLSGHAHWGRDRAYPEFDRLVDECDALSERITTLIEEIADTPASSLAGLLAKVRLAIGECPEQLRCNPGSREWHEMVMFKALDDVERVLGGSCPPVTATLREGVA